MRFLKVAQEDETLWDELEYPGEISTEEADVMQDEANALANEITAEMAEAETSVRVADSFEDVAIVASNIEEATPAETQLIQIAGDLAAASADDVTGDDLVPATEGFVGRRISTESFTDTARSIWNKIKAWLKSIWNKVEKWFYNIFGQIPRLRKNIESARKRIEKIEDEGLVIAKDGKNFEVTTGISGLLVGAKPVSTYGDLNKGLNATKDAVESLLKSKAIASLATKVAKQIDGYEAPNVKSATTKLDSVNTNINNALTSLASDCGLSSSTQAKWPGYTVDKREGLLGGKALVLRTRIANQGASALNMAEDLRSSRLEFTTLAVKEVKTPDTVKFNTMTTSDMLKLLETADKLLDVVESFHRGQGRKDVLKGKDEIIRASDKLENGAKPDTDKEREVVPFVRAMYKYNMMFTNLATTATTGAYNQALGNVRTVLAMVSRSCSQYKKQD